jgi:hypothetical protein
MYVYTTNIHKKSNLLATWKINKIIVTSITCASENLIVSLLSTICLITNTRKFAQMITIC